MHVMIAIEKLDSSVVVVSSHQALLVVVVIVVLLLTVSSWRLRLAVLVVNHLSSTMLACPHREDQLGSNQPFVHLLVLQRVERSVHVV